MPSPGKIVARKPEAAEGGAAAEAAALLASDADGADCRREGTGPEEVMRV
jgi:hypothetical protein